MPSSLRGHLLLAAATLVVLAVLLASAASTALFGRRLVQAAQFDMVDGALRAAERLQSGAPPPELGPRGLSGLLRDTRRRARIIGSVLLLDGQGRVIAADLRGLSARLGEDRLPPRSVDAPREPSIGTTQLGRGPELYYTTVAVPELAASLGRDEVHVAVLRPARELRGLWRSILPSVVLAGALGLAASGLVALTLARTITRPVEAMTQAAERIADGDYSVRVPERGADEIARLATAFNAMAEQVGEAQRRQRELVVNVGHDLRTPLTTLRGFAEALVDGTAVDPSQRRAAAQAIAGAASRMAAQVEQLLEQARLEGQSGGLERERVRLHPLLEGIRADLHAEATKREVAFELHMPSELSAWADPRWLGRAIQNIMANAIRYSPHGGTVRIEGRQALPKQPRDQATVELVIIDQGPGVAPEERKRIFERFYRGDRSRRGGGSGLGLSIAQEIIAVHDGTISVDSREGEGARFTIRLPSRPSGAG